MKYLYSFLFLCPLLLPAQNNTVDATNNTTHQIVGVDQFGRSFTTISGYKPKKQVGIFYWPWIGQPYASGIYDATVISAMPNGLKLLYDFKYLNDSISPTGQAHFWGEPLWGYYNSDDKWVIRKQMKMLTIAGIDFIAFDLTNRLTYRNVYEKVFSVIEELIEQGWSPPRAVFYTHSKSFETTWQVYNELYKPNLYPKAWYRVKGKPMIIAYTKETDDIAEAISRKDSAYRPTPYSQELKDFFYFKKPQWPFDPSYEDGFPWVEWSFPQPLHGGVMNVTVASHPKVPMSRSLTSGWENWGRGWDPVSKQNKKEDVDIGGFFQKQWDHALQVNPDTVFVGGWNEWIAYKQPWGDEYMLCDAANKEYSRDIEPMRGGYQDAFYIQLIKNIRQYKGLPYNGNGYAANKIDISRGKDQWEAVKAVYKNIDERMEARNSYGASKKVFYSLPAPVNNLKAIKVTHDGKYFYFLVEADKPFVHSKDASALQLLMGINEPANGGWNGYDYLVELNGGEAATLSRLDEQRTKTGTVSIAFVKKDNWIQFRIPRRQLGGKDVKQLYFKVADGVAKPADIMEYYISGSVMPVGRLSYLYRIEH